MVWLNLNGNFVVPVTKTRTSDEQARLLLVLRTPTPVDQLKDLLPHLEIKLAAHATDAVPQGSGNAAAASGKHDLTSLVVSGSDTISLTTAGETSYAVWQPRLHLPRPRVRLQRPAVYFTGHLTMTPAARGAAAKREWNILKPYEPLPRNLLAPLHFDPRMAEQQDYFSAETLTPQSGPREPDELRPVRAASKRALPIIPAFFMRTRYSVMSNAVVASVHVETSRLISGALNLHDFNVSISDARVEDLSSLQLPIESRAGDEIVALYKLTSTGTSRTTKGPISVKIRAKLSRLQRAEIDIDFAYQTSVDLSQAASRPSYRWSRPLSSGGQQPHRRSIKEASQPPVPGKDQAARKTEAGVTFKFSAPHMVFFQETFFLKVMCINDTDRIRRFTLVSLQERKPTKARLEPGDQNNADRIGKLFNAPPLEATRKPDVQDVEPDVRVGPVPAEGCWEVNVKLRANTMGALDLGTIRIVDLDSRRTVDVRDLPDVIAPDVDANEVEKMRLERDGADRIVVLDTDDWEDSGQR